jgi:serine-type D-Ala-D-Ala carboxypeptidase (penicillin-binding protein 5/6)
MRKLVTFLIVLIIQISIIFALYKWYVNYDNNSLSPKEVSTDNLIKQPSTAKKISTAKQEKISNPSQITKNEEKNQLGKKVIKNIDTKDTTSDSSLIYKNTVWGDIPSLKRSKMAKTGILVDIDNRKVLWAKKCRKSVPIASMVKMMTVLLAFEQISNKDKDITLNTIIPVTVEAYKIGGHQVYLDPREKFSLKKLLKTIMISSANDSAYLVAQYLGNGNVDTFVKAMNKRAKELHMPNAHFSNPDGLPEKHSDKDNKATAEGLVFLAEQLLKYPLVTKWANTRLDYFRKDTKKPMMLVNTNRLVRNKFNGITGMKTGYTRRSGFCLTATCDRNGKRLVAVVTGFNRDKERNEFVKNLLNWGYKRLALNLMKEPKILKEK